MEENWLLSEFERVSRRKFLAFMGVTGATLAGISLPARPAAAAEPVMIKELDQGMDVFAYIGKVKGGFDQTLYQQVIGAANAFKEGDLTIGVGAKDDATRENARKLLANTRIKDLYEHPLLVDDLQKLIWRTTDQAQYEKVKDWTMGELK
ncbi:MAG TPA: ethanolamine ammonia-lyase subunit EutB, partial [Geobacteraceae bacterium]|nr:ethanolamine ammonia-lyase subunit EutB [Geobacteraceae bacterium]